jgi:hypothetical protein
MSEPRKPRVPKHGYADDNIFRQEDEPQGEDPLRECWWWGQNRADHEWGLWSGSLANPLYYPTPAHAAAELRGMADYYRTLAERLESQQEW